MHSKILWNPDIIQRYNHKGPRYTSYPTALEFHSDLGQSDYLQALDDCAKERRPLSLYLHIPFCKNICYYCGCNKIVSKHRNRTQSYLKNLYREIEIKSQHIDYRQKVEQLHLGGGTPNFLSHAELTQLKGKIDQHFNLVDPCEGDFSIEVDPREADITTMLLLKDLGFNRISLGVQDFDPEVQKAINRVQPEYLTMNLIDAVRLLDYKSVNLDLIYGLPKQSLSGFLNSLDKAIQVRPDRFSIFNYAHLPERFKPQRKIKTEELPSAKEKLAIMEATGNRLIAAGYKYIGMDHFALPDDDLACAQREGSLHRNFQGYSTKGYCDIIGLGVSAISKIGPLFMQNHSDIDLYEKNIEQGKLSVNKGLKQTAEDQIRAAIIGELICHFRLNYKVIEKSFAIDFAKHFETEVEQLQIFADDGLITLTDKSIKVTDKGRILIRNICMVFDQYLEKNQITEKFSNAI